MRTCPVFNPYERKPLMKSLLPPIVLALYIAAAWFGLVAVANVAQYVKPHKDVWIQSVESGPQGVITRVSGGPHDKYYCFGRIGEKGDKFIVRTFLDGTFEVVARTTPE